MAEHIYVQEGGAGMVIKMDLPLHEAIADRLTRGHLRRVTEDGSPYVEPADQAEQPPPPERPAASAVKAEWVGYAVRAYGVSPDDAEAMTKQDLIDRYGRDEPAV